MKQTTKEKIMTKAIEMFNSQGYGAVSLHQIAGALDMSRGNVAYHFKDKDTLLFEISEQMWEHIHQERAVARNFPSFENLHRDVQLYYRFQKAYSFVFLDNHVLNHPIVAKKFRAFTDQSIKDNEAAIAFSISTGNMNPEPYPGVYHNIAFTVWMLTFYWLSQQIIRGETTEEDGEAMIWSLLVPHFTPKGLAAFKSFFGNDYLDKLGKSFSSILEKYVSF